jgi:type IV pilus assembly protein PilV
MTAHPISNNTRSQSRARSGPNARARDRHCGAVLLESVIAIVVFSFGLLAIVGLQAKAITTLAHDELQTRALDLAQDYLDIVQISVARTGGRVTPSGAKSLDKFTYNTTTTNDCNYSGGFITSTATTFSDNLRNTWLTNYTSSLPGASNSTAQVTIDTTNNLVTVRLCWKTPKDNQNQITTRTAYVY